MHRPGTREDANAISIAISIALALVLTTACAVTASYSPDTATDNVNRSGATTTTDQNHPGSAPLGAAAPRPPTTLDVGTASRPTDPAAAGTLIAATPINAPAGSRAWRIVYHSVSVGGADIAVTGIVVSPENPSLDTPLITYGHATTGSADSCAPSLQGTALIPFPTTLARLGWTIVQTDYEGLGSTDVHPYLVGASEARSMLDAARAVRQIGGSGVSAKSDVMIWGFSQGGHAAAFAGQMATTYAPELPIRGVAIAAPVSDVTRFARRAQGIPSQFGVLVTIVGGFVHAYPELDPRAVFGERVVGEMGELEKKCIGAVTEFFDRPIGSMLLLGPTEQPAFAARMAENQTALAPVSVPMLVVQGGRDDIIDPADTQAMVSRYCSWGTLVQYVLRPDKSHGIMDEEPFVSWTRNRLAGATAPSTC